MNAVAPARAPAFERYFAQAHQREACIAGMTRVIDNVRGAYACLIATLDGQPVAHVAHDDCKPSRLAAITASLCALGETLSGEIRQPGCRNILIETDTGLSIVQRLPAPAEHLVLLTASNRESNLGVLLSYSRACAAGIARVASAAAPRAAT